MGTVIMLYQMPVHSLEALLDAGLYIGHQFECDGEQLIVSFIGKPMPGAEMVSVGFAVTEV